VTNTSTGTEVRHGAVLRVSGGRSGFNRQGLRTLSGVGAQYGDYDGPEGPAKYAEALARNQVNYQGGPKHDRHSGAVWLSAEATVVAAKEYHEQLAAEYAQDVEVAFGDVVRVRSDAPGEGGFYLVLPPRTRHLDGDSARLVPCDRDGTPLA